MVAFLKLFFSFLMANKKIKQVVEPNISECRNYLKKGPQVWREETLFSNIKRFPKASFYKGSLEGLLEDKIDLKTYYQIQIYDEYQTKLKTKGNEISSLKEENKKCKDSITQA